MCSFGKILENEAEKYVSQTDSEIGHKLVAFLLCFFMLYIWIKSLCFFQGKTFVLVLFCWKDKFCYCDQQKREQNLP